MLACAALLTPALQATPIAGQTLVGSVLDQTNEQPVPGAVVSLLDRDGAQRAHAITDSIGRFTVAPPRAGEYFIHVDGFGYAETQSPLLALSEEGTAPIELMLVPEPIGLEGLEISVEELAAEELTAFGLSPRELGNRWIDRQRIEAIPIKRDLGSIIERVAVSNTRIIRPENLRPGSDDMGLCIALTRARTGGGRGTCALIVLNGIPIGGPQALAIDPETIESMAVLQATEAATYYGTLGSAGAVLVWTRRGG